jgi:RNA polymerase sigma-70 factor, ECF subfamily
MTVNALPCPTFEQVYESCFAFVFRNARRLGVAESSIDDVVQEVFMVVHRRLRDYDGRASVRAWIYGILSHVVRDYRRRVRRRDVPLIAHDVHLEDSSGLASPWPQPSRVAEQNEALRYVLRLLDRLDDSKREVLVLSELEQMTVPEIAETIGANPNTVYSRLKAAKKAFLEIYHREEARASGRIQA